MAIATIDTTGDTRRSLRDLWETRTKTPSRPSSRAVPWWVSLFVAVGRPTVAVTVLVLCAPGEKHLAKLAGWSEQLAWGMAAILAAYAGIAAVVAGQRPRGTAGHWTAVLGAGMSLVLAMAAQTVSHLAATGYLDTTPHAPMWLVITTSCVPAFVLGHLLHLAATPLAQRVQPPAPEVPEGLLSTQEVADRLGITRSAVSSRVHRGTLVPTMRDPELGNLFDPASF